MSLTPAYGPHDLTFQNPSGVVYLLGNEFTDGSVPEAGEADVPHLELRTNGIWANTGLLLSPETLFLGDDVSLSVVNGGTIRLQVNNIDDASDITIGHLAVSIQ